MPFPIHNVLIAYLLLFHSPDCSPDMHLHRGCPGPWARLNAFAAGSRQPRASSFGLFIGLSLNRVLDDLVEGSLGAEPCLCLLATAALVPSTESRMK